MKKLFKNVLVLSFIFNAFIYAENNGSIEFINQDVKDILIVLAKENNVSVSFDDSVSGKYSFCLSSENENNSIEDFLNTTGLFYSLENNIYKISRIKGSYNAAADKIYLSCNDVEISKVFDFISEKSSVPIIYTSLPSAKLSLNVKNISVKDCLEICVQKIEEFTLVKKENYFLIEKKITNSTNTSLNMTSSEQINSEIIKDDNNLYSAEIKKDRIKNILSQIFKLEKKEIVFFFENDFYIENITLKNKTFENLLTVFIDYGNLEITVKNEIYYVIERQKNYKASSFKNFYFTELNYITVSEAINLLPQEFSSFQIHFDKQKNSLAAYCSDEEIKLIEDFLNSIDCENNKKNHYLVSFNNLNCKDGISILQQIFPDLNFSLIQDSDSFVFSGKETEYKKLLEIISKIDIKKNSFPVILKNLSVKNFIENLPSYVSKEQLQDSGYPNLLFYSGTEENFKQLQNHLLLIDKPIPQIRYKILVIQFNNNSSKSIKPDYTFGYSAVNKDDNIIFNADLSNIFAINFDIISKLGPSFAFQLNSQISDNKATICTDTNLTGISGQTISFQNTDTYRYIEYEYDKINSSNSVGITQTITSGLILELTGNVSGDDFITVDISASISKQNTEGSSSGNGFFSLPSTSERSVNTKVRTKSGEPIIIGGLIKEENIKNLQEPGLISKIPIFGALFKNRFSSKDKSEIRIYLIPSVIKETVSSFNQENFLKNFCEKNCGETDGRI